MSPERIYKVRLADQSGVTLTAEKTQFIVVCTAVNDQKATMICLTGFDGPPSCVGDEWTYWLNNPGPSAVGEDGIYIAQFEKITCL